MLSIEQLQILQGDSAQHIIVMHTKYEYVVEVLQEISDLFS